MYSVCQGLAHLTVAEFMAAKTWLIVEYICILYMWLSLSISDSQTAQCHSHPIPDTHLLVPINTEHSNLFS